MNHRVLYFFGRDAAVNRGILDSVSFAFRGESATPADRVSSTFLAVVAGGGRAVPPAAAAAPASALAAVLGKVRLPSLSSRGALPLG